MSAGKFPRTLALIDKQISLLEQFSEGRSVSELVELFYKADLRAGTILSAADHLASKKLFVEQIDLGGGEVRQILSGLKQVYRLEEVTGPCVVFYNLSARKMGGLESNGMVMCTGN